jgi:hypothetical protein
MPAKRATNAVRHTNGFVFTMRFSLGNSAGDGVRAGRRVVILSRLQVDGTEIDALPTSMTESFCGAGRLLRPGDLTMANPTPSGYNSPGMTNHPT